MAISVSPKTGIGDRLREARLRRGEDLEAVARITRIKPRLLEALEREAPPRTFGAPVYARAFLRTYARYLGLPAEPLVEEYRAAHGDPDPSPVRLPGPVPPPRRWSPGHVVLALVTAAALVGLGVVTVRSVNEAPPDGTAAPRAAPEAPPEPVAPAEEGPRQVRLRVRLVDGPSWLRVVADGEIAVRGRRDQGFNRLFRAERRIRVEIDDAGAARLVLNGERLGAPGPRRVSFRATYVLRDGEIQVASRP